MTTDNRTNEPTPEQVEAAAKAAYEFDADVSELFGRGFTRDFDGMPQWAKDTHLDKARAVLVAAQGVANLLRDDAWLTEYTRVKQAEAWDACREALYNRSYDDIQDQWLESINPYREGEGDD